MIDDLIVSSLVNDDAYTRRVLPYIKREYFSNQGHQVLFSLVQRHFAKYNRSPSKDVLKVELSNLNINENMFDAAVEVYEDLTSEVQELDWMLDATEDFCKKRAYYNAIVAASDLLDKDDTAIYSQSLDMVKDALAVSFDSNIGHDYIEDAEERFKSYAEKEDQLPVGINIFDKTTKGGYVNKSLTLFMAPTGVGKSLFLCNFAAEFLRQGKNVLYLTMEMSEKQVSQRIDLNLLDMETDELLNSNVGTLMNRLKRFKIGPIGRLVVKEFASGQAHSGHFRHTIEELKLKKNFKPDVIIIDYLNICASSRVKQDQGGYTFYGTIAQELRGLGQEFGCRVFSATQTNRDGTKVSDFDVTDIADSWGVTHHCDYIYGIIETEELAKLGQYKVKRLKDRYNDYKNWYPSFIIGTDKSHQRLFDINEDDDDDDLDMSSVIFDQTDMGAYINTPS